MKSESRYQNVEINSLGFYLNRALWTMVKKQHNLLKESNLKDITHIEFITIKVLNDLQGASQALLSKVMCIDKAAISRTISSLEKKGYIKRSSLNGSTNFITLTQKSYNITGEIDEISDKVTEIGFKGFSKKRQESLINNLTKIYHNLISELE